MRTVRESDLTLPGGATLHTYDTGPDTGDLVVVYHHGSPNVGLPPTPLFPLADQLGVRWVSYDRPGYGGSTPSPGRDVASGARLVEVVTQALGIERFATLGHSSGGTYALASAALLPDRVLAVATISSLAPYGGEGLDYFEGMAPAGVGALSAAAQSREARARHEETSSEEDTGFIAADEEALSGEWAWMIDVVRAALAAGPDAQIDDDVASVSAWGFDPNDVQAPALIVHGGLDRMVPPGHARWLAERIPGAELRVYADDGHVSVLHAAPDALAWLAEQARPTRRT